MSDYIEQLNIQQKEAVQHINGPLMVIAGAGSGKTRVLTSRIVYLLQNNINAYNILALTFTNKAAQEMKKRIAETIDSHNINNLWIGTFHSIFSKILRFEAEKINYPSNFTIYDTDDSKSLLRNIIKERNLDKDIYKLGIIRNRISSLKNNFITSNEYQNHIELIESDRIAKRTEFGTIYKTYEKRCHKASAMDFDDLLIKTYQLLKEFPEISLKYQNKFKYILIDEYQDTNHVQYLIIKQLAKLNKNICVVGDDAQSIYSFRGANIQNILDFKVDYPNYSTYKLEQNYRSTSTIVEAANSVIQNNKKQIKKKVWTSNEKGEKIIVVKATSDNEESKLVANTIHDIKRQNSSENKEFTILYRTNAQSRALEESLRKSNLPYKIFGGLSFYQRKEIKDLLAYYRLTINPNDEEAFRRIINFPARGIGITTIQRLNTFAINHDITIWEVINNLKKIEININNGTQNKLINFSEMINGFIIKSQKEDAYEIAETIAKETGIINTLYSDKTPEGINRLENIQELLNGIKVFSEENDMNSNKLTHFMQEVSLLTDQDLESPEDFNKITLMTIHAAKGLEFPYVFIVGLEEDLFPSMMSKESQEQMEEERRLFYVAITRAQKRLFISFASNRFKWGQFIDCQVSRFISELDPKLVDKKEMLEINQPKRHKINLKKKNYYFENKTKNLKKLIKTRETIDSNLNTDNIHKINSGAMVHHSKFGEGKVISISGEGTNKIATVFFNNVGQKQLLLKFAKLEIKN